MASVIRVFMMVGMVACLASVAHAIEGEATFYTPPYYPSACGAQNQGVMIAAVNSGLYANGGACGRMYSVRCIRGTNAVPQPCRGNSVTVRVVDLCPGCNANQIDLSQEAFNVIANPDAGRVIIDYTQV